ncbi:hypothetical protein [Ornithinibacillus bavariensis]|uniref:Uncharacterized protein n=1 Tax=Ornithinibacillus bavariensis TaxID=545502 RepID=A0A920C769_9BACI|nr:hypothetical protein [Ornithinibacillus bavariensis]GIO26382.1 hypothetical protein J43TS3_09930 [Ornithinibacillus bavariensis]
MSNIKLYDPDMLLIHVEGQTEIYNRELEELKELQKKQQDKLLETIKLYKPIMKKIYENDFLFTHPTLNYQTSKGPILGYDKDNNSLITYDITREVIVSVNLYDHEEKGYRIAKLVENGFYNDAITGIKYIGVMIDNYLSSLKDDISKAKSELENS